MDNITFVSIQIAVSYQDNTALQAERLRAGRVEVTATVGMHSGRQRIINFDPREDIKMSSQYTGVWELDVDLKSELCRIQILLIISHFFIPIRTFTIIVLRCSSRRKQIG